MYKRTGLNHALPAWVISYFFCIYEKKTVPTNNILFTVKIIRYIPADSNLKQNRRLIYTKAIDF